MASDWAGVKSQSLLKLTTRNRAWTPAKALASEP